MHFTCCGHHGLALYAGCTCAHGIGTLGDCCAHFTDVGQLVYKLLLAQGALIGIVCQMARRSDGSILQVCIEVCIVSAEHGHLIVSYEKAEEFVALLGYGQCGAVGLHYIQCYAFGRYGPHRESTCAQHHC